MAGVPASMVQVQGRSSTRSATATRASRGGGALVLLLARGEQADGGTEAPPRTPKAAGGSRTGLRCPWASRHQPESDQRVFSTHLQRLQ